MPDSPQPTDPPAPAGFFWSVPSALAIVHILLHVLTAGDYGVFRDEFYYWDCANHLAWGYVDHPPLSIAVLALWKAVFGSSVLSLRILPALVGGAMVLWVAYMAALLGGGRFTQSLAALGAFIAPLWLANTGFYSMNAFELLFWAAGYITIMRIIQRGRSRDWIVLGVVVGLGLLNKISVGVFAVGFAVGLLMTPHRRWLATPFPYLAGGIAALLFAPHIVWQVANDWPTREFIRNAQLYKMADFGVWGFLSEQILLIHPQNLVLWVPGFVYLLVSPRMHNYRIFSWMFVFAVAVFLVQKSKPYYLGPAYPVLIAAGAIAVTQATRVRALAWLRPVLLVSMMVGGLAIAPLAVPILPVETFITYQDKLGLAPASAERSAVGRLPQHFADRFGWETLAADVAAVYNGLPDDEQASCLILGRNYGEAGALNYYGPRYGLPRAASTHNSYYLWGPSVSDPSVVIAVGFDREELQNFFESIIPVRVHTDDYAMPYESNLTIYECRRLKMPLADAWAQGRSYI